MKKVRLVLFSLICFFSIVFNVYSQNAPVTTISSLTASPGTIITLHLTQTNVVAVAGFGLRLDYDAAVLSFIDPNPTMQPGNWYNTNSALYLYGGGIVGVQTNDIVGVKKLIIYWSSTNGAAATPVTVGGIAPICDLQFRYYGGSTTVVFNNSAGGGQNCEYADNNGNPYIDVPTAIYYIDGNVSQNGVSTTTSPAISASASPSSICFSGSSTLSFTGGSLCNGASWNWYSGSCGGTYIATGTTLVVTPTIATTYFVRAEDATTSTSCVSTTVIININSFIPSSASATPSSICLGDSSTLSFTGGSLGTGANWYWYSGSCSGIFVATGTLIILYPTATTTYYLRAEGTCTTTLCVSVAVTVNPIPTQYTVSGGGSSCVSGTGFTIVMNNGDIGVNYELYLSGNSTGVIVTPVVSGQFNFPAQSLTGTYTVQATFNGCTSIMNGSASIIVNAPSILASSVSATPSSICLGDSSTLSFTGGSLGTAANWYWYSGSCTSAILGSVTNLIVTPTTTTKYYVKAIGICNTTSCISITVNIVTLPSQPYYISGNNNPITGNTETYSVTNVSGVSYTWSAPSGWIGTSNSSSITFIVGVPNGYITVIPSNTCGSGIGITESVGGYQISGNYTYYNSLNTPIDSLGLLLFLNGNKIDSTKTDAAGYYQFNNVQNGTYNIVAGNNNVCWGGVNITDNVRAKYHFLGKQLLNTSYQLHAADVNNTMFINTTDAIKIIRRYAGQDSAFTRGDWNFEKTFGGDTLNVSPNLNDTIIVNGSNVNQNFKGICIGDINGSHTPLPFINFYNCNYTPNAPAQGYTQNAPVTSISSVTACPGTIITLHITQTNVATIAGFSLRLDYDAAVLSFVDPNPNLQTGNFYNTNSALYTYGGDIMAAQSANGNMKKLMIVWFTPVGAATPVTSGGIASLFDLQFRYYGGTTNITWNNSSNTGQECEYVNVITDVFIDTPTSTYYTNGSITQCSPTPSVAATSTSASRLFVCVGDTSTLYLGGGSLGTGASWYWYSGSCGGTFIASGGSVVLSPLTTTTTYFVRAEGNLNTTNCVSITITVSTNTTIAHFNHFYSGNNSTFQFIDTSTTAVNNTISYWYWTFGDGHISTLQHPAHIYLAPGTYNVCLFVYDSLGCYDTYCDSVFVNVTAANCNLYVTYTTVDETTTGASDGSINLTANSGTSPYSFIWSNGATTQNISNLTSGYYNVTVSDNAGCASYASIYIDDLSTINTPIATLSNIPIDTCLQFNYDSVYVYAVYVINTTTIDVVWAFLQTSNGTIAYITEIYNLTSQGFYSISITVTCNSKATNTYSDIIYVDFNNILLAIDENKQIINDINIYPNPTKEILNITNVEKGEIHIYNVLGEEVKNVKCNDGNNTINVSSLTVGTYILKVVSAKGVVVKKIVINK